MFSKLISGAAPGVKDCIDRILNSLLFWSAFLLLFSTSRAFPQQTPSLGLQWTNGYVFLQVDGAASSGCAIQFATDLASVVPWRFRASIESTNDPAFLTDTNISASGIGFYRGVTYQVFNQSLPTNNIVTVANMIWIPRGGFTMGSPTNEALRASDETQYAVTLSQGFYIGQCLVSQSDYFALVGNNPSAFTTNYGYDQDLARPVERVSWQDATNFCGLLTQREQLAGDLPTNWIYRLPTESEWEYACRAGTTNAFYLGTDLRSGFANFNGQHEYDSSMGTITNAAGIYLGETTAVGAYQPNPWGLFDMCGNVNEWCLDWYGPYPAGPVTDPQGSSTGTYRVTRGGSWDLDGQYCRAAKRSSFPPNLVSSNIGFRIVLAPTQ